MKYVSIILAVLLAVGIGAGIVYKLANAEESVNMFRTVGFPIDTDKQFTKYTIKAAEKGKVVDFPSAKDEETYLKWRLPEGIEWWVPIESEGKIVGSIPFYSGKGTSVNKIIIDKAVPADWPMLGYYVGWVGENDPDSGYPIFFESPDFRVHSEEEFPLEAELVINAFAYSIQVFSNEAEFTKYLEKEDYDFTTTDFYPLGVMDFNENSEERYLTDEQEYNPEIYFTGIVQDAKLLTNSATGLSFYWISVQTDQLTIDVLTEKKLLKKLPVKGEIVGVNAWMVADWVEHAKTY